MWYNNLTRYRNQRFRTGPENIEPNDLVLRTCGCAASSLREENHGIMTARVIIRASNGRPAGMANYTVINHGTMKRQAGEKTRQEVIELLDSELSKIFNSDADKVFTEQASAEMWREIGKELGLMPGEIERTLPAATKNISAPPKDAKTNKPVKLVLLAAASVAAVAVAATLLMPFFQNRPTVTIHMPPTPAAGIVGGIVPPGPIITARYSTLMYPVGTSITIEELLSDAEVTAADEQGRPVLVRISGFDQINFDRAGRYYITLEVGEIDNITFKVLEIIVG